MRRRGLLWIVVAVLLVSCWLPADRTGAEVPAQEVSFLLNSSSPTLNPGGRVSVSVTGMDLADLYAYELEIQYDASRLTFVQAVPVLSQQSSTKAVRVIGDTVYAAYTRTGDAPVDNGSLSLYTLMFEAKAAGEALIHLISATVVTRTNESGLQKRVYPVDEDVSVMVQAAGPGGSTPEAPGDSDHSVGSSAPSGPAGGKAEPEEVSGILVQTPELDRASGIAVARLDEAAWRQALERAQADASGARTVVLKMNEIVGAEHYAQELSADMLRSNGADVRIRIETPYGTIEAPGNMLNQAAWERLDKVQLVIGQADRSGLTQEVLQRIGSRPIVQVEVAADGRRFAWSNPDAPVTVSVGYVPTAEERTNSEHIVVLYIDPQGNMVPVPSGSYDADTGEVTFRTTHFSSYAIAFVQKTFADLESYPWARKEIEVLASKGIINGMTEDAYHPAEAIRRADFVLLLMKTLELSGHGHSDADAVFADVSRDAYYYEAVSAAKALGLVQGSGDHAFEPEKTITRQDMMVLTARALRLTGKLEGSASSSALDGFADHAEVAAYVADDLAALAAAGLVQGGAGRLHPSAQAARAEAAVLLYRMLNMKQ
ncbi:S-layer homology domain-containing protein [Paenibacillus oryzisoli]|uniref:S-layer homology domain-containing protein n=1 Tax=Paenibacillus oryzisoli TaxID=1850517 RepID=UPI003D2D99DC